MMSEKVEVALGVFQSVCLLTASVEAKESVRLEPDLADLFVAAVRVLSGVLRRPDDLRHPQE